MQWFGRDQRPNVPSVETSPEVVRWYRDHPETERLTESLVGRLELVRTRDVFDDYLAKPPGRVLDVGGGTGIHAGRLAEMGYAVSLVDPVAEQVAIADQLPGVDALVGDARRLDFDDATFDAVLLLGPLYHLTQASDRHMALLEARRVIKPGGVLVAVSISRYAGVLDFAATGLLDVDAVERWRSTIFSGVHNASNGFTTSYAHRAAELVDEVSAGGFTCGHVLGIEGPAWTALRHADADEELFHSVLRSARLLAEDREVMAASSHIALVASPMVGHRR